VNQTRTWAAVVVMLFVVAFLIGVFVFGAFDPPVVIDERF
jgi:hypothetical protein